MKLKPLFYSFDSFNNSVVTDMLLCADRSLMPKLLHHCRLAYFQVRHAAFEFAHIFLDRTDVSAHAPQMFQDDVFDVLPGVSLLLYKMLTTSAGLPAQALWRGAWLLLRSSAPTLFSDFGSQQPVRIGTSGNDGNVRNAQSSKHDFQSRISARNRQSDTGPPWIRVILVG